MSEWLIAVVTLLYGLTCYDLIQRGDYWMALTWGSYGTANIGLIGKMLYG